MTDAEYETAARPRHKLLGLAALVLLALMLAVVYAKFDGDLGAGTPISVIAARSGLVMDPGSKVTFNGVKVGRVETVDVLNAPTQTRARIVLDIDPKSVAMIPANAKVEVKASTVFGNKYVAFSSPDHPSAQSISSASVIDVSAVTTEFNTLFETVMSVAQKIDPVQLNQMLTATAEALGGLGDKVGQSFVNGGLALADINPRMPRVRTDLRQLANLADIYSRAGPHLLDGLQKAVATARTLNSRQRDLDEALLSAAGLGSRISDVLERTRPYFVRGAHDLVPTDTLLDDYSPEVFCAIRNYHDLAPQILEDVGGNGYSAVTNTGILGAPNPYVYPDNLPRVNARGGPEGRPGCWRPVTRELWPAPYLVMDTGASKAPYNHLELGQPLLNEYVWGRQIGENTINP